MTSSLVDDWSDVLGEPVPEPETSPECAVCHRTEKEYLRYIIEQNLEGMSDCYVRRDIHPLTAMPGKPIGQLVLCPWCASYVQQSYKNELDEGVYKRIWAELEVRRDMMATIREGLAPESLALATDLKVRGSPEPEPETRTFTVVNTGTAPMTLREGGNVSVTYNEELERWETQLEEDEPEPEPEGKFHDDHLLYENEEDDIPF